MVLAQDWMGSAVEQERSIGEFLTHWLSASPTISVNTSGSTGIPKQLALSKEFMINSALMTGAHFGLKPGDTALLCLPANYIAGKMMLVRALVLGLHLDLAEPSSHPLQQLTNTYDFGAMVPLQALNDLDHLHKIKKVLLGGAPVSSALANKLASLENDVYETFGMTETITHIAVRKLSAAKHLEDSTYFQVLPGVDIDVDNRGCLVINAPKISERPIITNDLIALKGETRFQWLGRYDNVVNSGGIKLIPEQIEAKLAAGITGRFFLTGVPDPSLGEKLVLVVEGEWDNTTMDELKETAGLTKFELPKEVYTIPKFVETNSGKVNRSASLKHLQLK